MLLYRLLHLYSTCFHFDFLFILYIYYIIIFLNFQIMIFFLILALPKTHHVEVLELCLLRREGLEPSTYRHMGLNHTRLPVPPIRHNRRFKVYTPTTSNKNYGSVPKQRIILYRAWLFQLLSIQPNSESSTKCRLSDASSIMCFYFLECFYTTIHNNTPKRIEVTY